MGDAASLHGQVARVVRIARAEHLTGSAYTLHTEGEDRDKRYPYWMKADRGDRIYAVVVVVFRSYKRQPFAPSSKANGKPPAKRKPS